MANQVPDLANFMGDRTVVFIGDDDHLSVLLSATQPATHSTVLEYDDRISESILSWKDQLGLDNLTVAKYDVRNPLPADFTRCGAFCINPPYSSKTEAFGIKLWLSRALDATEEECIGVMFLPTEQWGLAWVAKNHLIVQDYLGDNGLIVVRVEPERQAYVHTHDEGLASSTLYLMRVDPTRRVHVPTPEIPDAIYR